MRNLLEQLKSQQPEMLAALQRMVELESPSSDKAAVDRLGAHLQREFERIGGQVKLYPQAKYGDHLLAEFDGAVGQKPVMLLGHFDTVWDIGTLKTMPWKVEGGRAWGPGVYDMKCG